MRVAVVTDSTCDLPAGLASDLDVEVVPLSVAFDGAPPVDRQDVDDATFYRRLAAATVLPTTSQPSEPRFREAWTLAAARGAQSIVSVHVSQRLSGTVERARVVASSWRLPVTVVDSQQVSGGLALQVIAAARLARAGADTTAVLDELAAVRAQTTSVLAVDTLTYLRRGGRLSGAQAAVGTALRVRPVLGVEQGGIRLRERTRTWRRATEQLVAAIADGAGDRPQRVVVAHALDQQRATALSAALAERVEVAEQLEVVIGPVVGTHIGPGAAGLAAAPVTARPGAAPGR